MSRNSTSSQRSLTLTEELEKLEQSITLTLQVCSYSQEEIDHNFSRAHRIVTTSILPIVEQYAEHSKNVWEGSKFWKQFFEASANVSLSGYEETPAEEMTITEDVTSQTTPSSSSYVSSDQHDSSAFTPTSAQQYSNRADEGDSLSFSSPSHSTPRASRHAPTIAAYSSSYETLQREVQGHSEESSKSTLPITPRAQIPSSTPESSPFLPPSTTRHRTPANDVLLHRILDKNYRLQATPHAQPGIPKSANKGLRTPMIVRPNARLQGDDLDSSPLEQAPQLHTEIFDSLARTRRVPGVSILTPAKKNRTKEITKEEDSKEKALVKRGVWDSDSDDDSGDGGLIEGMSPPKTMQFHIPQSKLLKTPAREASRRIVEDLLLTAGGHITDDFDDSPSIVKRGGLLEEDTF